MEKLKQHNITLRREQIVLRPMTENDWDILLKWNSDPEILYYSEGDDVTHYSLEQVQRIYRSVSQNASCFIIEYDGKPIGECWLQQMNLERILANHPGLDCRRIDLIVGEKDLWGKGIGTEVVRLLAKFGFEQENADAIFACDVRDYNVASMRMFEKAGFEICSKIKQRPGSKGLYSHDLALKREKYLPPPVETFGLARE
jgi:aminoglycoside 6'-N-acetyltransferase